MMKALRRQLVVIEAEVRSCVREEMVLLFGWTEIARV